MRYHYKWAREIMFWNTSSQNPYMYIRVCGLIVLTAEPISKHSFYNKYNYFTEWINVCLNLCSTHELFKFALLTHWGRDKMAAISHTTFLDAFSSMKMVVQIFHWSLFLRVKLTLCRELVCITVKWTWYNVRDSFFHITSGRINTWKGVNQLKELFFLNLIFFFNLYLKLSNHRYFIIKNPLLVTIHNKNGVLL